jgi:hypothetical protein
VATPVQTVTVTTATATVTSAATATSSTASASRNNAAGMNGKLLAVRFYSLMYVSILQMEMTSYSVIVVESVIKKLSVI